MDILPGAFDIWVGLCICFHIMSCMYNVFVGNTAWRHSIWATTDLPNTMNSCIDGDTINVDSMVDFWMGCGPKDIWPECTYPIGKIENTHRCPMSVWAVHPWGWWTQQNNKVTLAKPGTMYQWRQLHYNLLTESQKMTPFCYIMFLSNKIPFLHTGITFLSRAWKHRTMCPFAMPFEFLENNRAEQTW